VLVVLIQSGKGAEISTSFGGSSQTVFGSSGGANFFTRFTSGAAAVFMVTSIALTLMSGQSRKSVFEGMAGSPSQAQTQTQAQDKGAAAKTNSNTQGAGSEAKTAPEGK